jgi:DNA-binding NtrC family response regulator
MPGKGKWVDGIMKDIFIVEDDTLIAMLLEDMLVDLGYRVCASAPDLERALTTARDTEFDAAILDVSLAGQSSLPVAKLLDERGKPYLYATGYGTAPDGSSPSTLPVLQKPFQLSELEQAMKQLTEA